MKPINEWTLKECIGAMRHGVRIDDIENGAVFIRLSTPMLHDVADRITDLTRWIPVEERMPTEEDVMNTNDDIHSYMNGLVLWLVAHESGRLDYLLSKWYMPPSTYNKLLAWRRIDKP